MKYLPRALFIPIFEIVVKVCLKVRHDPYLW